MSSKGFNKVVGEYDGTLQTSHTHVTLPSDYKPLDNFKTFMRVNIETGDYIVRRKDQTVEDIDNYKWSH